MVEWKVILKFTYNRKQDTSKDRVQNVLLEIRKRAKENKDLKAKIVSVNNFPTAAGLASSASGYCNLVFTLAQAYKVEGDLTTIARVGSGSACRSMYGGFVKWVMGEKTDGTDSIAVQVQPETHWDDIQILVCVVSSKQKETSSTAGMRESAKTSELLKKRVHIVPERIKTMEKAIKERDFETFANLTMIDSDDFHAVCKDTTPSIVYLNDVSNSIIKLVQGFNKVSKSTKVAYTFDAGPNACLFVLKKDLNHLLSILSYHFPNEKLLSKNVQEEISKLEIQNEFKDLIQVNQNGLQEILLTTVGPGPQIVSEHLIQENGEIKQ